MLYSRMFFGSPPPFPRFAPAFLALASFSIVPPINGSRVALFGPDAVLSDFQLSTINCQLLRVSRQATHNEHLRRSRLQRFCNEHLQNR